MEEEQIKEKEKENKIEEIISPKKKVITSYDRNN